MKIIKTIGLGILVFTFFYLMHTFFNATFDISLWSEESRFMCSFLGGGITSICMAFYLVYEKR